MSVSLDELRLLFAGEQVEGVFLSAPCPTIPLATAICRLIDCTSEQELRKAIFGFARPESSIDDASLATVKLGFQKWQNTRHQQGRRGL